MFEKKNHPLLKEYIATIEESLQDFQKRRVRYVLEHKFKDVVVSLSELKDAASVKVAVRKGEGDIKRLVKEHNQSILMKR
ncbi:hypothetical protein [Bacillus cereus group sp. RP32]|uniref:hypothetical protein n=1 Tax=Bacillus cereus group sp. RP32 TaxID=3040258 RepID=UPI003399D2A9